MTVKHEFHINIAMWKKYIVLIHLKSNTEEAHVKVFLCNSNWKNCNNYNLSLFIYLLCNTALLC